MPSDAKLGLIVGLVLVLAVAVLFFPHDPASGPAPDAPVKSALKEPMPPSAAAALPPPARPEREIKGRTASRIQE